MTVRIALLGCGTVGHSVATLLQKHASDYAHRIGDDIELVGIGVRDVTKVREGIDPDLLTDDLSGLVQRADVVIELIGGIEPARTLILEAIDAGASVVTGNKALLATHGPEIHDRAAAKHVDVYYEASVAGAVPVVYAIRESLAGDSVTSVLGILNGTTNYILDEMESKGLSFDEALAQAQDLGFAEADPTADVDGFDAAAKIAILASLAFHTRVSLDDVPTVGIRDILLDDLRQARSDGYALKLIASAKINEGGIDVRVEPTLLPLSHPLANIRGSFNAIVVEAAAADRLMFYGRGAGGAPTASSVLGDVVAACAHKVNGGEAPRELTYSEVGLIDPGESVSSFRIEIDAKDEAGVLAQLAGEFASNSVSIKSVSQDGRSDGVAHLAVTTHEARQARVDRALAALGQRSEFVVRQVRRVEVE